MYENPKRRTYSFNAKSFAGGVSYIIGPKGKRGRVVEVAATATTNFTGTTSPGYVQVDDGATAGLYAKLAMGAAAAGTQIGQGAVASSYASGLNSEPASGGYVYCPADTPVKITYVAPVGTPAGAADVFVTVDWD